jgi:hypothetical protein
MSVARVQFGSSASATVTLGSATTAGNLLIVLVSADGANSAVPSSITLGGSAAVFTNDASVVSTNSIATITLSLWSLPNIPPGSTTVLPNFSGGSPAGILVMVWEVSGAALTSPLAGTPGSAANPASTLQAAWDSGAGAAVAAGCFWAGGLTGVGSGGRATPVVSGSWTGESPLQPGSATDMLGSYQAGPGGGAPEYAGTFSGPVAGAYWAAIAAAYSPASGGGGATVSGVTATETPAAPAGTVTAVTPVAGPAAVSVLAAPAGTPGASESVAGPVAPIALAAPAGTVGASETVAGPVAPETLSAPAGTPHASSAVAGPAAGEALAAPAGTIGPAIVAAQGTVTISNALAGTVTIVNNI